MNTTNKLPGFLAKDGLWKIEGTYQFTPDIETEPEGWLQCHINKNNTATIKHLHKIANSTVYAIYTLGEKKIVTIEIFPQANNQKVLLQGQYSYSTEEIRAKWQMTLHNTTTSTTLTLKQMPTEDKRYLVTYITNREQGHRTLSGGFFSGIIYEIDSIPENMQGLIDQVCEKSLNTKIGKFILDSKSCHSDNNLSIST